jgi:hypothetical protein
MKPNVKLPVPKPASPDDVLPETSDALLVAANGVDLFIQLQQNGMFVPVSHPGFTNKLKPPFPKDALVNYKLYWEKVKSWRLGPGTFQRDVVHRVGTATQDSTTISAELGVTLDWLSAKLSGTLNHSISITQETETSEHYSFTVPDNKTCIFTIWNLVQQFEFTDSAGNLLNWSGAVLISENLGVGVLATLPKQRLTNRGADVAQDPVMF